MAAHNRYKPHLFFQAGRWRWCPPMYDARGLPQQRWCRFASHAVSQLNWRITHGEDTG